MYGLREAKVDGFHGFLIQFTRININATAYTSINDMIV